MRSGPSIRRSRPPSSESTKRLNGVLKKFGGPRCHRLVRLNVGAPSDRTVVRSWNRDLFRYATGDTEATFVQLAKELAPKVARLGLAPGEKLPCEFQFDETPILRELSYSQSRDAVVGSAQQGPAVVMPRQRLRRAAILQRQRPRWSGAVVWWLLRHAQRMARTTGGLDA